MANLTQQISFIVKGEDWNKYAIVCSCVLCSTLTDELQSVPWPVVIRPNSVILG